MKKIKLLILLLMITLISCSQKTYVLSNFNAVGKIEEKKEVDYEAGNYKYLVRIEPEIKVWVVSNDEFNVNDSIILKNDLKLSNE